MKYKYVLLKTSWGIVIFLEVEEVLHPQIGEVDIRVTDHLYLRINEPYKLKSAIIVKWIVLGLSNIADKIFEKARAVVCLNLKALDFSYSDFQEEGLYCAIQGWASVYYGIEVDPVKVEYDPENKRYEFDFAPL